MFKFDNQGIVGVPFDMGREDCYEVCRKFFHRNFGIELPPYARPNDWSADKDNLIDNLYSDAGFEKLDVDENWPPRPADVLATVVGGSRPNHLVIYLGGNEILHHKYGALSCQETMRPAWKRYTSFILRHPQVPDLTPKKPTMDLMEAYRNGLV